MNASAALSPHSARRHPRCGSRLHLRGHRAARASLAMLACLGTLAALSAGCSRNPDAAEPQARPGAPAAGEAAPTPTAPAPKAQATRRVTVDAALVERRSIARTVATLGTLEADERVAVNAEIAGTVREIHFREGDRVKPIPATPEAGPAQTALPILFVLDQTLPRCEVKAAEARLVVAGAALHQQEAVYERQKALHQAQATTDAAYQDAFLALQRARAGSAEALTALQLARARLEKTEVRAPIPGVLGERTVGVGDYAKAGAKLVELVDADPIRVTCTVPERYQSQLRLGLEVHVRLEGEPGPPRKTSVTYLAATADPATGSIRLKADLPNPDLSLRPGLFAKVEVVLEAARPGLVVPEEAIVPRGGKRYVYIVGASGVARRREVQLGQRLAGLVAIDRGVKDGERVITAGLQSVSDGFPVVVRPQGGAR